MNVMYLIVGLLQTNVTLGDTYEQCVRSTVHRHKLIALQQQAQNTYLMILKLETKMFRIGM
jgi:hypothetical protein